MASSSTQYPVQLVPQNEAGPGSRREDLITAPPGLWLPSTVVRRHRAKATAIWIALLAVFCAYVVFIIYDGIKQRKEPAASMEIKGDVYKFPDIGVCIAEGEGCYTDPDTCFGVAVMALVLQSGFLEDPGDVEVDEASAAIEEAHPHCKVLPLSKMTLNQEGIDDGSVTTLSATMLALWVENPFGANENNTQIFSQVANIFFVNVDDGPEAFGNKAVDAVLPYDRITPTTDTVFTVTQNHVVMTLTEFTGISDDGTTLKTEQNFVQRSTSGKSHWFWSGDTMDFEVAFLWFTLLIPKFEFTSIEEVDPVDAWTIIGAIGGVWQFVVVGFGLFLVFSDKQEPEFKMRNFGKTIRKPASIVGRHLSSMSSKGDSTNDVVISASDEDLPRDWVKKQRPDGSVYYHNLVTNVRLDMSPNEIGARGRHPSIGDSAPALTPAHGPSSSVSKGPANGSGDGHNTGEEVLPPGWIARTDGEGRTYYMNTIEKTSQWRRPTQRSSTTSTGSVQVIDAPIASSRRGSGSTHGSAHGSAHGSGHGSVPAPAYTSVTNESEVRRANPLLPHGQPTGATGTTAAPAVPAARGGHPTTTSNGRPSSTGRHGDGGGGGGGGREAGVDASQPLPPNWAKLYTTEGRPFYANEVSKETQWAPPRG